MALDEPLMGLRALVLGASGMIGAHTTRALLAQGVQVRALVRPGSPARNLECLVVERAVGSLEDPASIELALRGCDLLVHAAAPYPRSHFEAARQTVQAVASMRTLLQTARTHVPEELLRLPRSLAPQIAVEQAEGAARVAREQPERAESARRAVRAPDLVPPALEGALDASLHPALADVRGLPGLKRIVYVSSLTTIGRPLGAGTRLASESDRFDPATERSPYFRMKAEMEDEARRAANEGLPLVIVNPTLCIDTWDVTPTTGQLLLAVAHRRLPFGVPGVLNAVATRDVAVGIARALAVGRTGARYILGGENLSIQELFTRIARAAQVPPPRGQIPLGLLEVAGWGAEAWNLLARRPWPALPLSAVRILRHAQPLDMRRARRELDLPNTPLDLAIRDALAWLRAC